MRLPDEPDNIAQINIVPMIDVVFAILTFLIISSLSLSKSEGLPVNLPKASTSQAQEAPSKITITIEESGKLMVDKKSVNLDQIEGAVREVMGSNQTSLIILNADKGVNHGNVVEVMDRLRRIKGAKLGIATIK
ncbi:biopolymer transporter ExbD [Tychonema sp. LEGE 07199]|uniref:ExbD/TolR family protein n=1 Tax=unclassified Tychonema TaxID=2642144 RepID=UPI00188077BE|nr:MULTISPECIES: biopolymer transporter ExbD [unclassified Tychonema]MBE9120392.1 biopolymer transporter ExbD [Tychonema sp. LEGE 07199]MBE9130446.1 biopolymer transporter ExbD [Tychonema sp. LEGE 07196]